MVNLFLKFSGLGWVWTTADGYKSYIAAAISISSGLAGLLQELLPLLAAHNGNGVLSFLKALPQDQAWLMLAGGIATLGLRHSIQKTASPPTA